MRRLTQAVLTAAALALLAGPVAAQFPIGGLPTPGNLGGNLIQLPDVQKELKLTEDQQKKMKQAQQDARDKFKDDFDKLKDLKPQERFVAQLQLTQKVAAEAGKEMEKILTDDQKKRVKQIETQIKGVAAFSDPTIVKELDLSDDQKTEVAKVTRDMATNLQKIFTDAQAEAQKGNFQAITDAMKKVQEENKAATKKVADSLKDDQKKKWKDMTGEPFELKTQGLGGFGIGGGIPLPVPPSPGK